MNLSNTLNLIGWLGYEKLIDVFHAFEIDTGIHVNFRGFRNQDDMLEAAQKLAADVASPTTDRLASWIDSDLIQAWSEPDINIDGLDSNYLANHLTVVDGKRMGSPCLWGSAGLGFDKRELSLAYGQASLIDIFDDRYAGRVTLRADTAFVAAGRALDAQGRLPYSFDESYIDESKMIANYDIILDFLLSKKKNVAQFWFSEKEGQDAFSQGGCVIGYSWDSSIRGLQRNNLPIGYLAPTEGAVCYLQNFVLLKGAKNTAQAHTWVAWINSPKNGAMWANAFGVNSTAKGAIDQLDGEARRFFEAAYPDDALERLWWQPSQPSWFSNRRMAYAKTFEAA